ncbi:hypothetical protein L218DRAFT_243376 [Marasmius fiardii PR-910]|nr:hypothetical protein L218DRAFT_243376 [Marasmius fiardii PR-910]
MGPTFATRSEIGVQKGNNTGSTFVDTFELKDGHYRANDSVAINVNTQVHIHGSVTCTHGSIEDTGDYRKSDSLAPLR